MEGPMILAQREIIQIRFFVKMTQFMEKHAECTLASYITLNVYVTSSTSV